MRSNFDQNFFGMTISLIQSEFDVVYLDLWVWDIRTILWDKLMCPTTMKTLFLNYSGQTIMCIEH